MAGVSILPLDAEEPTILPEKEIAYCCGNQVVARYVYWKQSKYGLITDTFKNVVFIADILPNISDVVLEVLMTEFIEKAQSLLHTR
jgi:DNA/RNA-binding domain of Phe-tRNA-synthetase-like protein